VRIDGLNELDLLAPAPPFNLFFAIDRSIRIEKALVVNQTGQVVSADKTFNVLVLVVPNTARQVPREIPLYKT
jgi:hypothetical protein